MSDQDLIPEGSSSNTAPISEPSKEFLRIDENTVFNSPEDTVKAFREGTMRHSEHKKAMDEYKSNSTRFENERAAYNRERADWEEKGKKIKEMDEFLKSNPGAYKQMEAMVLQSKQGGVDTEAVDRLIDQKYGARFKKMDEDEKRRLTAEERDRHYDDLTKRYPDFNKDAVGQEWEKIMSPDANMGSFLELLYHAIKGRGVDPVKMEEQIVAEHEKKRAAAIPTSRGGAPPSDSEPANETIKEAAERLKKKRGG